MSSSNDYDVKILNGLIETTLDSAEGYGEAAKEAKNLSFKSLFQTRSSERQRITSELQSAVRALGGEPADDGTILASAHRLFLNLRHAVSGGDAGVVAEVEAGEDHIKAKYEAAIADTDLSSATRALVTRLYRPVKADHDKMRDLKHTLQGA